MWVLGFLIVFGMSALYVNWATKRELRRIDRTSAPMEKQIVQVSSVQDRISDKIAMLAIRKCDIYRNFLVEHLRECGETEADILIVLDRLDDIVEQAHTKNRLT